MTNNYFPIDHKNYIMIIKNLLYFVFYRLIIDLKKPIYIYIIDTRSAFHTIITNIEFIQINPFSSPNRSHEPPLHRISSLYSVPPRSRIQLKIEERKESFVIEFRHQASPPVILLCAPPLIRQQKTTVREAISRGLESATLARRNGTVEEKEKGEEERGDREGKRSAACKSERPFSGNHRGVDRSLPRDPGTSSLSFIQINLLNVSTGIARVVKLAGLQWSQRTTKRPDEFGLISRISFNEVTCSSRDFRYS